jgi:hypothetical protein
LQDGCILGEDLAIVAAQRRDHAQRVDGAIVGTVHRLLDGRVDFDETGLGAGLIERNPGRHRAGKGCKEELHDESPAFIIVPRGIE